MHTLIIGGTAFTGPHIVRRLVDQGHEVTLFHRGKTAADLPGGVNQILGDRDNLQDHRDELRRIAPDVVLDMIPITEEHARVVMDIFAGLAKRVVAISSQDVYRAYGKLIAIESAEIEPDPITEQSPLREKIYPYRDEVEPGNRLYDYDKILVERIYMGRPDLPGTIVRYPMVYGPNDRQHRMFAYLKRMEDKRPAILLKAGMADWRWTKGYVEDMANAVVLAVTNEQAAGQIYNVGDTNTLSEFEWIRAIATLVGWNGRIVSVPSDLLPEHLASCLDPTQHLVTDSSKIRKDLGYNESIPRDEALRLTVAWEQAHPPEQIDPKQFDYEAEDATLAELESPSC